MGYDYNKEIFTTLMRDRALERKTKPIITARQWQGSSDGACTPMESSFETIFAAYHDFRNSQQWN